MNCPGGQVAGAPSCTPGADGHDGTAWPVAFSVLAYGVRVGVRLNDPRFADAIRDRLPPGTETLPFSDTGRVYSVVVEVTQPPAEPCGSVYVDGLAIARRASMRAVLDAFEGDLQVHVAEMAPDRVFVHAAVVGWQGRAILLPGRSFSGKTTLVTALVRVGAEYYSDEYAVLDTGGFVHAYPRPPAVRQPGGLGTTRRGPGEWGGRAGLPPLQAGVTVMTTFRADAEWRPRRLSPGQGFLAMLANTLAARRNPEIVLETLQHVLAIAPVFESERADASAVAGLILALAARQQSD